LKTISDLTNKYDIFISDSENCLRNTNTNNLENDYNRFKFSLEKTLTNNSFCSDWNTIKTITTKINTLQKGLLVQFYGELQNITNKKEDPERKSPKKQEPISEKILNNNKQVLIIEKSVINNNKQVIIPEKNLNNIPKLVISPEKNLNSNLKQLDFTEIFADNPLPVCQNAMYLRSEITINPPRILTTLPETIPNCDFIIGLKSTSSDILVYHNEKIHEFKFLPQFLNNTRFKDRKVVFPFKHSKYVNIGETLILTGGYLNEHVASNECLAITASVRDKKEVLLTFGDFPSMNDKRERHNMIYLPNFKTVLVCCHFQTITTCEIIELNNINTQWKKICPLHEPRANATMAYVDNRWVYCLSGFKVHGNGGKYLDSYEVLDYTSSNRQWQMYNFDTTNMRKMSLSAMGVIPCSEDRIILVGGYDGYKYVHDVFTIEFSQGEIKSANDNPTNLDQGIIFTQNSFVKSRNRLLNFDFNNKLIDISLK
jgi:hypothetical protein